MDGVRVCHQILVFLSFARVINTVHNVATEWGLGKVSGSALGGRASKLLLFFLF